VEASWKRSCFSVSASEVSLAAAATARRSSASIFGVSPFALASCALMLCTKGEVAYRSDARSAQYDAESILPAPKAV